MLNQERLARTAIHAAVIALCAGAAAPALATNGYFSHGYGAASKAMAGVGAAFSVDSLAPAANPAGLTEVGDRIDLGLAYFSPDRGYAVDGPPSGACMSAQQCTFGVGPQSLRSEAGLFLIPHFGYSRRLNDDAVIGLAVYGNGGMNTKSVGGSATFGVPSQTVPPGASVTMPGTFGGGTAGVDLTELFVVPTYARRVGGNMSLGVSPILAAQRFEARGLAALAPFSSDPTKLTNNGHDMSYGYGIRVGLQAALGERVRFGAAYQSRIWMSEFDKYAGLFAEQGDFDIPASATVGVASQLTDSFTMAFDVQWIGYSDIAAVSNPMLPNLMIAPLGSDGGAGFGWEDMTVYKLGAEWRTSGGVWRAGFSKTEQPIKSSEVLFNILAPGVVERHFTLGYANRTSSGAEWTISAMYAPSTSVRGVNPLDPAQTIELSMDQFEIGVNFAFGR